MELITKANAISLCSGGKEPSPAGSGARVIAVTSGKGGVGKTNIVANLGFAIAQAGKRVLILDADLGLGNLDVMLGIAPRYNLSHVINGERPIEEVVIEGPGRLKILPAASGIQTLTHLDATQRTRLSEAMERLLRGLDVILIDTAAGISADVMYFNVTAREILVVVSPEPTSITDAYALMKVLSMRYATRRFSLLVNMASSSSEARDVFRQIKLVADRFLDVDIEFVGYVTTDAHVSASVKRQQIVSELYPDCPASRCFVELGRRYAHRPSSVPPDRNGADGLRRETAVRDPEPLDNR